MIFEHARHAPRFNGMPIFVTPDTPRMQLSARVCEVLTPEMIADHNAWLAAFFGTENALDDDKAITAMGALYMNPRMFARLRAAMS